MCRSTKERTSGPVFNDGETRAWELDTTNTSSGPFNQFPGVIQIERTKSSLFSIDQILDGACKPRPAQTQRDSCYILSDAAEHRSCRSENRISFSCSKSDRAWMGSLVEFLRRASPPIDRRRF